MTRWRAVGTDQKTPKPCVMADDRSEISSERELTFCTNIKMMEGAHRRWGMLERECGGEEACRRGRGLWERRRVGEAEVCGRGGLWERQGFVGEEAGYQ